MRQTKGPTASTTARNPALVVTSTLTHRLDCFLSITWSSSRAAAFEWLAARSAYVLLDALIVAEQCKTGPNSALSSAMAANPREGDESDGADARPAKRVKVDDDAQDTVAAVAEDVLPPSSAILGLTREDPNRITELDVGISQYISKDVPRIDGIIKQRCAESSTLLALLSLIAQLHRLPRVRGEPERRRRALEGYLQARRAQGGKAYPAACAPC